MGWSPRAVRYFCLTCLLMQYAAGYLQYDLPAIMSHALKSDFGFDNSVLGLVFAVYGLPNVVMPLLGGMAAARFGSQPTILAFGAVVCVGAVGSAYGVYLRSLPVLLGGRFVLGVGSEALYIAMESLLTERFREFEISFAYASIFSAAQCGSFVIYYFGPLLADHWAGGVGSSDPNGSVTLFAVAAVISCSAFTFNVIFWLFDRSIPPAVAYSQVPAVADYGATRDVVDVAVSADQSHDALYRVKSDADAEMVDEAVATPPDYGVSASLSFLRYDADRRVWLLLWSIVVYCVTVFPFQEFAPDYFETALGATVAQAGWWAGLLNLVGMLCGPAVGAVVDRIGHRSSVVAWSWLLATVAFVSIGFHKSLPDAMAWPPALAMVVLAVSVSTVQSVLWSLLPLNISEPRVYSVVYGLVFCVMNLGQLAVFSGGGHMTALDPTYRSFFTAFVAIWCVGLALVVVSAWKYPQNDTSPPPPELASVTELDRASGAASAPLSASEMDSERSVSVGPDEYTPPATSDMATQTMDDPNNTSMQSTTSVGSDAFASPVRRSANTTRPGALLVSPAPRA